MLVLTRETLRDLAPGVEDAAAVRGGDTSMCGAKDFCEPRWEDISRLLGRTMMSWGCKGRITVRRIDDGQQIDIDLGPSEQFLKHRPRFPDEGPRQDPLG